MLQMNVVLVGAISERLSVASSPAMAEIPDSLNWVPSLARASGRFANNSTGRSCLRFQLPPTGKQGFDLSTIPRLIQEEK